METDDPDLVESLQKAKRACRIIKAILIGATFVFALFWLVMALVFMGQSAQAPWIAVAYALSYGAVGTIMLWELSQLFAEVEDLSTPFSEAQSYRLRKISLLALVLVVIELICTAGFSYIAVPELGYGIVFNNGVTEPTINLNIGMLVFSAIMYSLSVIFRYAALLQQLSDDTV